MATILTREAILAADDLIVERMHVPGWNGDIFLKSLSAMEREEWDKETIRYQEVTDRSGAYRLKPVLSRDFVRAKLLCRAIVGQDGERLFKTHEDIIALSGKAAGVLEPIYERVLAMNGLSKKEVEEIGKNTEDHSSMPPPGGQD